MSQGRAERVVYNNVSFLDWNRYNINTTTELAQWVGSFGQEVNDHFSVNENKDGLLIRTPMGEFIPVEPGDIIVRDDNNGNYFRMSAKIFDAQYKINNTIPNLDEEE